MLFLVLVLMNKEIKMDGLEIQTELFTESEITYLKK